VAAATYTARARLSANQRHHGADSPQAAASRMELREAKLADAIKREAAADPPLTVEQRSRLAVLLLQRQVGGDAA
jgi:hypothetical protein